MKLNTIILFLLFALLIAGCAKKSKVTMIIDGDTFMTNKGEVIRIIGIDAPELNQFSEKFKNDVTFWQTTRDIEISHANASKRALQDKILNKKVTLKTCVYFNHEKFRAYRVGRKLRYVSLGGEDISSFMISSGHARIWDYTFSPVTYFHDMGKELKLLQIMAKKSNTGVWSSSKTEEIPGK